MRSAKSVLLNGKRNSYGPVMLDVIGLRLLEEDIRRIRHPLTGGVILFARNYQNREQLMALTKAIRKECPNILIAVDHEGGSVQRFRFDGFTRLPPMKSLGKLWDSNQIEASCAAMATGYVLASELRACGIDFSFTPVLDLDYGVSTVIGDRSFHRDPQAVTFLAKSLNYGLSLAGMANCGKHYPGHGYAIGDSHTEIPVDDRPFETIFSEDMIPYKGLGMSLSSVMPAHVIYPKVDAMPAGFSKKWISILRNDFAFDGVIFSDDLSMKGASVAGDIVSRAKAALEAGCNMVLVCNSPTEADTLLSSLGPLSEEIMRECTVKIAGLAPKTPALDWNTLQAEKRYQRAQAIVKAIAQD